MKSFDTMIVGAGPAGSALAALLAQQGQCVALIERDRFPRDKLCGEFLSPESRVLFERIGCLDRVLAAQPACIAHARFSTSSTRAVKFDLPGRGMGLSRRVLDQLLFDFAVECGAHAVMGAEVRDVRESLSGRRRATTIDIRIRGSTDSMKTWAAPLTVLAHGRRSGLDRRLGRFTPTGLGRTVAFKRHMRVPEGEAGEAVNRALENTVEVHTFSGGYCGLCFVDGGRVNVCSFVDQRLTHDLKTVNWDTLVESMRNRNALLDHRFEHLIAVDAQTLAVADVPLYAREARVGGLPVVGDSAGMVAPLCGGGQVTALRSAVVMAEICAEHASEDVADVWERRWREEFSTAHAVGRCLQGALTRPRLASLGLTAARLVPPLGRWLVSSTRTGSRCRSGDCRAGI